MNFEDELAPAKAGVGELVDEFRRCGPDAGGWNRVDDNERVRFAVWENQSSDGKKHSSAQFEAKPWEGASDLRDFLVDDVVSEEVAVCCASFWRAMIRAQGVQPDDAGTAAVMTRLLDWIVKGRLANVLLREVELSAQYIRTYGWAAIHPTWVRELGMRNQRVTLDEFVAMSPELAVAIVDEAQEAVAVEILGAVYGRYVAAQAESGGVEDPPPLPAARLRRMVRDLRKNGKAVIPVPYLAKSQPSIEVLRPFYDVFIPDEIGDPQRGRTYVRHWYRAEDLKAKIRTDGWDEDWVREASKTAGYQSVWTRASNLGASATWTAVEDSTSPWIEVVTCYSRRIGSDGVPGFYCTTFSPHVTSDPVEPGRELVAVHGLLDYQHGQVPIVVGVREWVCRSITNARGVPEVAAPMARLSKVMQDSLVDRTALTTLPPRMVPARLMDEDQEFGPAATIPVMRGEEPRFMDVPAHDGVAEGILRWVHERVDQSFARLSANVPPARVQARQQHMVNGFLGMWAEAFRQVLALILQYMPAAEFQRVTGFEKPTMSPAEIAGSYDLILAVDVRELDMDFAIKQLQAVSEFVLPEDATGVVDRAKLVRMKLQAINPLLAREIVSEQAGAQQRIFKEVSAEIASMFLGNPPTLVENEPTAPMQLQFAAQVIQANPNYQQALQQGGRFAQTLEVWAKNRMQSKVQQENKVVGRLGVRPVETQGQP